MKESRFCLFAARVTHVYAAFVFQEFRSKRRDPASAHHIRIAVSFVWSGCLPLCCPATFYASLFFKGRERVTIDFTAIDRGDKIIVSSTPNSINPRDKIYYSYRLVFCSIYVLWHTFWLPVLWRRNGLLLYCTIKLYSINLQAKFVRRRLGRAGKRRAWSRWNADRAVKSAIGAAVRKSAWSDESNRSRRAWSRRGRSRGAASPAKSIFFNKKNYFERKIFKFISIEWFSFFFIWATVSKEKKRIEETTEHSAGSSTSS